jgi:hypothetical protein
MTFTGIAAVPVSAQALVFEHGYQYSSPSGWYPADVTGAAAVASRPAGAMTVTIFRGPSPAKRTTELPNPAARQHNGSAPRGASYGGARDVRT